MFFIILIGLRKLYGRTKIEIQPNKKNLNFVTAIPILFDNFNIKIKDFV